MVKAATMPEVNKILETKRIMTGKTDQEFHFRMYLARKWLFRDRELERKQLPWSDAVLHERYEYNMARHAVKASLVLGRAGYVVAQILTRFVVEREKGIEALAKADLGTKTKTLAINRHGTQFSFAHCAFEVPFGMTSREARFKAKLE